MADRYWVGGTGDWNATNTTNWSTASGGAGGASVPTIGDNVFFDQNSDVAGAAFVVTITQSASSLNFTVQNLDSAMTLAGSNNLNITGNLSLPATNFTATYTGNLSFTSSSPRTVNTNGVTLACNIFVSMSPSTLTLQAALTTTGSVTLTVGTLDLGGFALTSANFLSSNSSTRSITFGTTGSINLSGSGTVWDTTITSGFTYTGTSNIRLTNSGSTATAITTGNLSLSQALNFNITAGTYNLTLGSAGVFNDLNFTGFSGTFNMAAISATVYGNITFSSTMSTASTTGVLTINPGDGTKTITSNGNSLALALTLSGSSTTLQLVDDLTITKTFTHSSGTLDLNSKTLSVQSFASPGGTRVIAFGTGSIITTGTGTVWNVSGTVGLSFTGTSNITISNNTATAVTITNTATATSAMNFNIINGTYTLTLTTGNSYRNLNFTGFAGTVAFVATTHTLYGDLTLGTGTSTSATAGTATLTLISSSTKIIRSNGVTANFGISLNGIGQTVQLADALVQGSTQSFFYANGTFDMAGYSTSLGTFVISNGTHAIANGTLNCAGVTHTTGDLTVSTTATVVSTGTYTFTAGTINIGDGATLSTGAFSSVNANARTIAFNTSGILALTGSGTVWNTGTVTNFGYTGTSNIRLTYAGSVAVTITAGQMSLSQSLNFYVTAGTYSLTTTNSGVFNTLDFTGFSGTYAQAATTITVRNNLVFSGTMSTTTTTGSITMGATSGTKTITTNGATLTTNINFNGVGGTFQLTDNFTQTSTASFILTNGTVDFNNVTYTLGILTFVTGTKSYINYGGTLRGASIVHTSGTVTLDTGALVATAGSYTFTAGTITLNNGVNLSVGSMSSANTNTRVIAFGTGSITTTGTGTVWNVTGSTGLSYTGTSNIIISNNTATAVTVTNTATAANAMNLNFINGTYTLTLNTGNSYNNLNFTGFAGTVAFGLTSHTMYGNLTLGASTNTSATAGTTTIGYGSTSGTRTITTNGATANFGIIINGVGQTVQLADAFVQGSTQRLTIASGTFDMAGYSTSVGVLTINTGTHAIANGTLNCASVTHTNGDLSMGTGYTVVCSGTYAFTAGSITINDGVDLLVGSMSSVNTGTRSIAFGTGSITTTGTGSVWSVTGVTGMSYTGTPTVNISNNTSTAITVTNTATILSAFDFKFINGTYTLTLTNGNIYRSLNFTGFAGTVAFGATTHSLYGDLTLGPNTTTSGTVGSTHVSFITGILTKTITTNGRTVNFTININGTSTTVYLGDAFVQGSSYSLILTVGTFDMAGYSTSVGIFNISNGTHAIANGTLNCASVTHTTADLTVSTTATVVATGTYTFTSGTINIGNGATLTAGAFSSSNSNARSIAFNTSGVLALTGSGTVWNTGAFANFSYTGTSNVRLTYAGALSVTVTTGAMSVAQSLNFYITAGTYNLTTISNSTFNTLDFTGFGGTYAQATSNTTVYGNLTFSNLMTSTSTTGTMTIAGTANTFIYGNGHTVGCNIKIRKTSDTAQTVLGNAFSSSYTNGFTLEGGIFDTAGYNFAVVSFDASNTTLARSIKLNSSNVTITGVQWLIAASNLTVDAGTSTIDMTSNSSKSFYGGGFTWYNLNQGGAGSLSIADSSTFNNISNSVQPATVNFENGSNTTVSNFSLSGTAGNPITITSTTGSHTLTKTSGEVFVNYCIISNSNATGGASWRAPTNYGNTNGGFNTGWNFSPTSTTAVLSNMIAFF